MKPTYLILLLATVLSFSGCATIVSGSTQKVTLQSNPPGAVVSVDGNTLGTTPLIARVKRSASQAIEFSKDGFETLKLQLRSGTNGWFWGNILFGGLLGSTTDSATGSIHEYSPSEYLVTLQPKGTSAIESGSALTKAQRVREFVVVNDKDLRSDLRSGNGNFLASLLQLLEVQPSEKNSAVSKIGILANNYSNTSQFADNIVSTYVKE